MTVINVYGPPDLVACQISKPVSLFAGAALWFQSSRKEVLDKVVTSTPEAGSGLLGPLASMTVKGAEKLLLQPVVTASGGTAEQNQQYEYQSKRTSA